MPYSPKLQLGKGKKRASYTSDDPRLEESLPALHIVRKGSIQSRMKDIRSTTIAWSWDWGPENAWEVKFQRKMKQARDRGGGAVDIFIEDIELHAKQGRTILHRLRSIQIGRSLGEPESNLLDFFAQALEMGIQITSEVKFFEVKLDEYAPVVTKHQESTLRYVDSGDEDMDFD